MTREQARYAVGLDKTLDAIMRAVRAETLAASPLPEALALIERLMVVDAAAFADTYGDAAEFLARVREG